MKPTMYVQALISLVLLSISTLAAEIRRKPSEKLIVFYGDGALHIAKSHSCFAMDRYQMFNTAECARVDTSVMKVHESLGLLGLVEFGDKKRRFIVSASNRSVAGRVLDMTVYEVESVFFIPLDQNIGSSDEELMTQKLLGRIQQVLTDGFYYCETHDLSLPMHAHFKHVTESVPVNISHSLVQLDSQRSSSTSSGVESDESSQTFKTTPMQEGYFLTSKYMRELLIDVGIPEHMIIRSFRGHFESKTVTIGEQSIGLAMISCTSPERIGTRYHVRGADLTGNVANCVKTELVIWKDDDPKSFTSYAQLRGSLPMIWREPGGKIDINSNQDNQVKAAKAHFSKISQLFGHGPTITLNLLEASGREEELCDRYARLIKLINRQDRYVHFPFHTITTEALWKSNLVKSLPKVDMTSIGFTLVKNGFLIKPQRGIIRANCLDCMDRTSQAQRVIFESMLFSMLSELVGSTSFGLFLHDLIKLNGDVVELCVNTAHTISRHYSGSLALRTDLSTYGYPTYTGKLTDMMKSAHRSMNHLFWDFKKQGALDTICGFEGSRNYPMDGWQNLNVSPDASILGIVNIDTSNSFIVNITGSEAVFHNHNLSLYKVSTLALEKILGYSNPVVDEKLAVVEKYLHSLSLYYLSGQGLTLEPIFHFNKHMIEGVGSSSYTVAAFKGKVKVFNIANFMAALIKRESVLKPSITEFELCVGNDKESMCTQVVLLQGNTNHIFQRRYIHLTAEKNVEPTLQNALEEMLKKMKYEYYVPACSAWLSKLFPALLCTTSGGFAKSSDSPSNSVADIFSTIISSFGGGGNESSEPEQFKIMMEIVHGVKK
jgi:hypothetical protein